MSYFLEAWLRGREAEQFRQMSSIKDSDYYPHITLVRPFSLKSSEADVKQLIVRACQNQLPIGFRLKGESKFEDITYIPVISDELLSFSNQLEEALTKKVQFVEKLDEDKTLHLTVKGVAKIEEFPDTDFYMLRLTAIRDKLIWFSYDFVTCRVLDREESLDKNLWEQTISKFHDKI